MQRIKKPIYFILIEEPEELKRIQRRDYFRLDLDGVIKLHKEKKDGSAMISVWSREQDKFRELFNKNKIDKNQEFGDINIFWRQDKLDVPRFYHLYSEKEFKEDINNAGLKIVNFQPVKIVSKNYYDNYFATVKN